MTNIGVSDITMTWIKDNKCIIDVPGYKGIASFEKRITESGQNALWILELSKPYGNDQHYCTSEQPFEHIDIAAWFLNIGISLEEARAIGSR